jgi:hypothetical protein
MVIVRSAVDAIIAGITETPTATTALNALIAVQIKEVRRQLREPIKQLQVCLCVYVCMYVCMYVCISFRRCHAYIHVFL